MINFTKESFNHRSVENWCRRCRFAYISCVWQTIRIDRIDHIRRVMIIGWVWFGRFKTFQIPLSRLYAYFPLSK